MNVSLRTSTSACYTTTANTNIFAQAAMPSIIRWFFVFMMFAVSLTASAQTTLISPTGDGGFENGATLADNGWQTANSATNVWTAGTVPGATFYNDSKCAFITSDGGTTWSFNNASVTASHLYKDVVIPAGEGMINLAFKWRALGESSSWDAIIVYYCPISVTPLAGSPASTTGSVATWTGGSPVAIGSQLWNQGTTNQVFTGTLPNELAGTTVRIIITWKNDGSGGSNPPAAVDSISLVSRVAVPADAAPTLFTTTAVSQTAITVGWTDNSTNETGFRVYRSTDNVTFTQIGGTIASTTTAGTGTTYAAPAMTGLLPGTTYYFRVAAVFEAESPYLTGSQATNAAGNITSTGAGGLWSATTTWVGGVVPTALDNVVIADGATVTVDATAVAYSLTVGSGTPLAPQAILTYNTTPARTLTVGGSSLGTAGVIINDNGIIRSNTTSPASLTANTLSIAGNMAINGAGSFNGSASANSKLNIIFTGSFNNTFTTSATSTMALNTITINKALANTLDFTPGASWTATPATTNGQGFIITAGTLKVGGTTTLSLPFFSAPAYGIASAGGLWMNNPNLTITGQNATGTVTGLLRISTGTLNVGTASGNSLEFASGSTIRIEGGALNSVGRVSVGSAANTITYVQSGGAVTVSTINGLSNSLGCFDLGTSTTSRDTITGGTITIQNANGNATPIDYRGPVVGNTLSVVSGGQVFFGNASTAAGVKTFSFRGIAPDVTVTTTSANHNLTVTASAQVNGTYTQTAGIFNLGTGTGNTIIFRGPIAVSGTSNTAAAPGATISFQGTAAQTIGGTFQNDQIANVIVNNTAGVILPTLIQINTALTLSAGNLSSSEGTIGIRLGQNGTSNFTYINSGGSLSGVVTKNYGGGAGANSFTYNGTTPQTTGVELPASTVTGSLTINNAAGVTMGSAFAVPTLNMTAGILSTTAANLVTVTGPTTGALPANITGGSATAYVNGPLAIVLPASLVSGSTYRLPIGKAVYQLMELINATTSAALTTVKAEVFDADPAGTYTGITALTANRYWEVSPVTGGTLTGGSVRLTEAGLTSLSRVGQSVGTTPAGTYLNKGGLVAGSTVQSVSALTAYGSGANSTYFVTGLAGGFTAGIYAVGPTANAGTLQPDGITLYDGFFATLTDAMAALNSAAPPSSHVIFELQNDYVSTSELYPLISTHQGTATSTLTLRPRSDLGTTLSISGSSTTMLIDLNSAKYVTIDGRPGATGSTKSLTITNTSVAATASTIRLVNEASNNTIQYCTIEGAAPNTTGGVIFISNTTGANGNDNITISNNDIRDVNAVGTPANGIYAAGTNTTVAHNNSNVTISNNNIYNYFAVAVASTGISAISGNTDWTVSNNKLYQEATRTQTTSAFHNGITLTGGANSNNNQVTGNTIGFASSTGTGVYTLNGLSNTFRAINLSVGNTVASNITGNTIGGISQTTAASGTGTSSPMMGIYVAAGKVANVTGNTIGSQSATGSISYTSTSASASDVSVLYNFSVENWNVSNNNIGGITAANTNAAPAASNIYVIRTNTTTTDTVTCQNNTIGGTVANSIQSTSNATGTIVAGIHNINAVGFVTGNTIRNMSAANGTGTTTSASVSGINSAAGSVQTISQNTISALSNSNTTTATVVSGMAISSLTSGSVVSRNTIYGLTSASTSATAAINGMQVSGGTGKYQNNMISLGAGQTTGIIINGISETGGTDTFRFNSVYIGGAPTTTAANTFGFASTVTTNVRAFQNNIFMNARSNSGSTGKHYAISLAGAAANPAGLTSNYNILTVTGTGGFTGLFNAADRLTLTDWKNATGQDGASVAGDPKFLNAAAAVPDLHIDVTVPSVAEGNGLAIATVTDDFDGQDRSTLTPTDIGADAMNGIVATPTINNIAITPTAQQCASVIHTVTATVTVTAAPITSVSINYAFNAAPQTPVAMTLTSGSATTGTSTWTGDIPVATPSNANVTWSVIASDGTLSSSMTGTAYSDDPLGAITGTTTATPDTLCMGSTTVLNLATTGGASSNYCTPVMVASFGTVTGDYLKDFTFGNITNNGTDDAATDYTYYSSLTANVIADGATTYNISLMAGGTTSLYNQQFRIWIDFNQNGAFEASESVFNTTTATFAPTVATGTATIPVTAYNGITRMRVMSKYSSTPLTTESCSSTGDYGEYEDYNVSITGGVNNPFAPVSYSWHDGTSVVGTTNPLTVTVNDTTTYTPSVTYSNGCTKTFAGILVVAIPLPAAPSTGTSTQCGTGVPEVFAAGSSNGNYRWYLSQNGVDSIPGEYNSTLTSYSINAPTTFWVSIKGIDCESARTSVFANVTAADAIVASADELNPCPNTAIQLSSTQGTTQNYTFTWTAIPEAGSGISGSVSGQSVSVTPTLAGTYNYVVAGEDGNCNTTDTVTVVVKVAPVITTADATPSSYCAGGSSVLTAATTYATTGIATIGTGVLQNTGTTYPAPFGNYYFGALHQILITKADLNAAGLTAGNITSLAFDVATPSTITLANFTIGIKATSIASMGTSLETGFTTVYTTAGYTPSATPGYAANTINFTIPFNWDGNSNIIIQTCFANGSYVNDGNAVFKLSATSYASTLVYNDDLTTVCSSPGSVTSGFLGRPNMQLGGQIANVGTGSLNWVWNPGALAGDTVTVSPIITQLYTVTATDPATGCFSTDTVTVTVNQLPPAVGVTDGNHCGNSLATAVVSSNSSATTPVFKWYDAAIGGNLLQTSPSTTYLVPISATQTFYVSEVDQYGCEGPRTAVTETVVTADPITAGASSASICLGGTVDLTTTHIPDFNSYIFTWTAQPVTGSGIPTSVAGGSPVTITPTAVGTYNYILSANDPDKGCTAEDTVTVTVNPLPTVTAGSNVSSVCTGTTVNLTSTAHSNLFGALAPVYSESFATVSPFPAGWDTTNASEPIGTLTWGQGAGATFPAFSGGINEYIVVNYNSVAGDNLISNWLFTPTMTMENGNTLSFYTRTTASSGFADRLQVRMSTNGASTDIGDTSTTVGDFSTLMLDINPTLVVGGYPEDWTQYTVTISGLSGPTSGRLAFRYFVESGGPAGANSNIIGIDDVVYSAPAELPVTYSWTSSPPGFTSTDQNPQNVVVNANTTYTVTVTNSAGCVSAVPAQVSVSVIALPAAPSVTNSTQCGSGIPGASASGGTSGQYRWYTSSTGGTALADGTTGVLTTTVITTTTSFWVAINDGTCESLRTEVVATVNQPDAVTASSDLNNICANLPIQLSVVQTGSTNSYVYTWTASPAAGSGIPTSVGGQSVSVTPTLGGTYNYIVSAFDAGGNCTTTDTVTVTINPVPPITSVTASPSVICVGGGTTLTAIAAPVSTGSVGVGSGASTSVSGGTPFYGGWGGTKVQYIYTAAQLAAAGVSAGNITALGLEVSSAPATIFQGFTISIGSTAQNTFATANTVPGLTPVFTGPLANSGYQTTSGLNTFNFTSPFNWDGTSNIVVSMCYSNNNTFNTGATVVTDVYGSNVGMYIYSDNQTASTVCGATTTIPASGGSSTTTTRPRTTFYGQVALDETANYNWVWTPGNQTGNTINVAPAVSTIYTVTATNPVNGCTSSDTVHVTVSPLTATASATPMAICTGGSVTLDVNAIGGAPFTYSWSNGTSVVSTSKTFTASPTVATTYTVTVTNSCLETTTSSVTVSINPNPTASIAEAGPISVCAPGTQVLTAVTDATSPNYQWSLNGTPISGATLSTYTVTSGTGVYTVRVTESTTTCQSAVSAPVAVTIHPQPSQVTVTPLTVTMCAGGTPQLLTSGGGTAPGSGKIGTGTGTSTTVTPYKGFWGGQKVQVMYTASELTAMGMSVGSTISNIAMDVSAFSSPYTFNSFRISMKNTTSTVLTGTLETGVTEVLAPATFVLSGTAPFVISHAITPFTWNGNNLIVEYCFNNNNGGGTSANSAAVQVTTTATILTSYYSSDNNATVCTAPGTATTSTSRPNMTFTYTQNANMVWAPIGGLFTNAAGTIAYTGTPAAVVYASPTSTTTYTVTGTSAAGCAASGLPASVTVTVNQAPVVSFTTLAATYCSTGGAVTLTGSHAPLGTFSGPGITDNGNGTASFNPATAGVGAHPIVYTYTDGTTGCTGTSTQTANVVTCGGNTIVSLKMFIQGYYIFAGEMQPVLLNQGLAAQITETDTVSITLHHPTTYVALETVKAVLSTTGFVTATFTQPAGNYYIGIRHRNAIQTWTAEPVACSSTTPLYDFTIGAAMALGDNQVMVETGKFAFYTGDINQDNFIDGNDFPPYDEDNFNAVNTVYVATDLNGDGFVDGNDFPVYDLNNFNAVSAIFFE